MCRLQQPVRISSPALRAIFFPKWMPNWPTGSMKPTCAPRSPSWLARHALACLHAANRPVQLSGSCSPPSSSSRLLSPGRSGTVTGSGSGGGGMPGSARQTNPLNPPTYCVSCAGAKQSQSWISGIMISPSTGGPFRGYFQLLSDL
jgi:hypothetical protein